MRIPGLLRKLAHLNDRRRGPKMFVVGKVRKPEHFSMNITFLEKSAGGRKKITSDASTPIHLIIRPNPFSMIHISLGFLRPN